MKLNEAKIVERRLQKLSSDQNQSTPAEKVFNRRTFETHFSEAEGRSDGSGSGCFFLATLTDRQDDNDGFIRPPQKK